MKRLATHFQPVQVFLGIYALKKSLDITMAAQSEPIFCLRRRLQHVKGSWMPEDACLEAQK